PATCLELEQRVDAVARPDGHHRLAELLERHARGLLEDRERARQRGSEYASEVADHRLYVRHPSPPLKAREHVDAGAVEPARVTTQRRDLEAEPVAGDDRRIVSCLGRCALWILLVPVADPELEARARGPVAGAEGGRDAGLVDRDPAVGLENGRGDHV